MTKFILGKKIGMTQIFSNTGDLIPVTVVEASGLIVIDERTKERDGYEAIQLGFGERKPKNIARPQREAWKELGNFEAVREARLPAEASAKAGGMSGKSRGEKIDLTQFEVGDIVKVSGISKAKGFQGVMKRHGFHGKFATHGTKHAHREPGSIGGGGGRAGGRVVKGMRMAGRMGGERISVKNLEVVTVDAEKGILSLKGAVPGRKGALLEIGG